MRDRSLSLCGFGRFFDIPLCSGSLFFCCHNFRLDCHLDLLLTASDPTSQWRRFRVRAAFFAAVERDRAERCLATRFACLDNACFDAERRLSRLSARFVARERFADGFLRRVVRPFVRSRLA